MMFITKMALPRRTVLRGLGGMLMLPLVDAMMPALSAASAVPRLAFFGNSNGVVPKEFFPTTEGPKFEMTPILQAFAPCRDRMVVLKGMSNTAGNPKDMVGG